MSSQFVCANCSSTDYFEDDQGYYICQHCGTMSQDFYAETNDMEDGAVTSNVRRVFEKVKTPKDVKKRTKDKSNPELLKFLEVYQFCLKLLLSKLLEAAEVEKSERHNYMLTLKNIWLDYLKAWNKSESECSILQAFVKVDKCCACNQNDLQHPLFPSKPLLIGFIYLTVCIHRSWITPPDIIRYCQTGQIPYTNLWDNIPQSIIASRMEGKLYTNLFIEQHLGVSRFISSSNILFHTVGIAESINIQLPSLNDHLIAYVMINKLGYPPSVWSNYAQLCQIHTNGEPLHGTNDNISMMYIEDIVVYILMAIKCCDNWQSWSITHNSDSITDISMDGNIARKDMKEVLQIIQNTVPKYTTTKAVGPHLHAYSFNDAILKTLDNDYNGGISSSVSAMSGMEQLNQVVTDVKKSDVILHANNVFDSISANSRKAKHSVPIETNDSEKIASYMTYARYNHEAAIEEGGQYDLPTTMLVERFASWIFVPPNLLHKMLLQRESVLIKLLLAMRES